MEKLKNRIRQFFCRHWPEYTTWLSNEECPMVIRECTCRLCGKQLNPGLGYLSYDRTTYLLEKARSLPKGARELV